MRVVFVAPALALAALLAGCVQPGYLPPQPIELQGYPPPITYRTVPSYRPPLPPPAAMISPEPAPLTDLLPPPVELAPLGETPLGETPLDATGPIPLQDMPAPAQLSAPSNGAAQNAAPAPMVQKSPAPGPGSNVPLEGFRPMRGRIR